MLPDTSGTAEHVDRRAPGAPFAPMVRWFTWYFRRLARRHFAAVQWMTADDPRDWGTLPILAVANHTTWWDGPLAYLVSAALGREFHVAMEAQHLARYPYFARIGAHPLRRTTPRARWEDLCRIGEVLAPGRMLWMFPQGARRPARETIGRLERGAAYLALCHRPVRIVPVTIRLAHGGEQLPDAFVRVGPSWIVGVQDPRDRCELTDEIGRALTRGLAKTDALLDRELPGPWRPLVAPTLSFNKRLDRIGHALGLLGGRFEPRNG